MRANLRLPHEFYTSTHTEPRTFFFFTTKESKSTIKTMGDVIYIRKQLFWLYSLLFVQEHNTNHHHRRHQAHAQAQARQNITRTWFTKTPSYSAETNPELTLLFLRSCSNLSISSLFNSCASCWTRPWSSCHLKPLVVRRWNNSREKVHTRKRYVKH